MNMLLQRSAKGGESLNQIEHGYKENKLRPSALILALTAVWCNNMPSHQDSKLNSILWSCEMFLLTEIQGKNYCFSIVANIKSQYLSWLIYDEKQYSINLKALRPHFIDFNAHNAILKYIIRITGITPKLYMYP